MNKAFIDKKAILAVDVSYHNEQAVAAGMLFSDWRACEPTDKIVAYISFCATISETKLQNKIE